MKSVDVHCNFNLINLDVKFTDKFCYLSNKSGTGKSFLFRLLRRYYKNKDITLIHVNYETETSTSGVVLDYCKHADIVCFDNADLYLTSDIIKALRDKDIQVIICMKDIRRVYCEDFVLYDIGYRDSNMSVRRCDK